MEFLKWVNTSSHHGFSYYLDAVIPAGETKYIKMPVVTPNKRGVNDIGFAYDNGITLFATLSEKPLSDGAIWQEIQPFDEINKTVACIKIQNSGTKSARVNIRAILN